MRRTIRLMVLMTGFFAAAAARASAPEAPVLRLPFVANHGQTDPQVAFTADTFGGTVFVTHDGEIVYALHVSGGPVVLREHLAGAGAVAVRGLAGVKARVRRFVGNDPAGWQQDVDTFNSITLGTPWPGIEVQLRAGGDNVEKLFHIAPDTDPTRIALRLDGARGLRLDSGGALVVDTERGPVRFTPPVAWQDDGAERRDVPVAYALRGDEYGFTLGRHDPKLPLTIDPALLYSTYLGGGASDAAVGIAVDTAGSAYVTGITFSANFPTALGWDDAQDLQNDIFVSKLTPDGSGLVFSTYLGGSSFEDGRAIALDPAGNIWVTGVTYSSDFPTPGSPTVSAGGADAYVARFDTFGSLSFARYLGGSNRDEGKAIAVDGSNNVVLLGGTASADFPVQPALQPGFGGGNSDAFIVKLKGSNPNLSLFSSFLGGAGDDCAFFLGCDFALDAGGDMYLVMDTTSTALPIVKPVTSPFNGAVFHGGGGNGYGGDVWLGRIRLVTSQVIYSSYIGGSDWDEPYAIDLDANGGVWLAGDTNSSNFPTVNALVGPGAYNGAVRHSGFEAFAMRLTWNGGTSPLSVSFSTYLGGNGNDHAGDLRISAAGDAWLAMSTASTNLPKAAPLQTINRGKSDLYFARLAWNGSALSLPFATYLGGTDDDGVSVTALGPGGDLFYAGSTSSIDFPVANPFQATAVGAGDAVVGRIAALPPAPSMLSENGYSISPHGTIRVLLVFAEVDYTACPSQAVYGVSSKWPVGGVPVDADDYFDHYLTPGTSPQGYMTKYYGQGSLGQYLVLGDYLPNVVTVSCNNLSGWDGTSAVISQLNALTSPLKTKHVNPATGTNYTLDDFDFWGNENPGLPKTNFPNGVIDAMLIVWRNNHNWCGACGYGLQGMYTGMPLQTKTVNQVGSYNGVDSGEGAFSITISEYFHALFGDNYWHTGSGAGNHTFPFLSVGSYSTTQGQVSNTVAGYDRFHMGWKNPYKQYLLSAMDNLGNEVESDISIQSHPFGATFILRDYYSTGDAVRIKLPHIDWQTPGDVKNQYLWLENHQRVLSFDRSRWEDVPGKEAWQQGLYVQLQVGKDLKSGNDIYTTYPFSYQNALASWLLQYTAEGNFDYMYRFDHSQPPTWDPCNWQNANIPTDRSQSLPNPLTGFSDVYRLIDSADTYSALSTTATLRPLGDGTLLSGDRIQTGLSDIVNGSLVRNCNLVGDSQDGFNSTTSMNTSLGIGSNPAPVPAYTLRSNWSFAGPQNYIEGYENRKIRLNNLSIEILGENIDNQGAMRIRIVWDDPRIKQDVRWAGDIDLSNDPLDPLGRQTQIELAAGKRICLDRGFSATKYEANPADGLFSDPTQLTLNAGTAVHLENNAGLGAWNGSQITIKPGASLTLDAGATLSYTPQPAAGQWASCSEPACTPAPLGMVAWWTFDETGGVTATDKAGNNHGTHINGPVSVPAMVKSGLRFDPDQLNPRHVRVPDAPALDFGVGSFTFDAWLKPAGPGVVLSKHDDSTNKGYEVFIDVVTSVQTSLRPVGMRLNGAFYYPSSCSVTLNQWNHLTLVIDRGSAQRARCYINGSYVGDSALVANGSTDNTQSLYLGKAAVFAGMIPYTGVLDEVELFNKALSQAAITAVHGAGAGGKCRDGCTPGPAGLDAWWPLDEPAGNTAYEIVSAADGTVFGATPIAGIVQGALTFDGTDDYLEVPHGAAVDVALGDFSVDTWVRTTAAANVVVLLDKRQESIAGPTQGWSLFLANGRVGFQMADGVGTFACSSNPAVSSCTNYISNTFVADGAWHHVAVSVDRDNAAGGAIVVDGARVYTFDPTLRDGTLANSRPLRFGKRSSLNSGHFKGDLDEIEIFHRALADSELGALWAARGGGKCKARIDAPPALVLCPADSYIDVPLTICNDTSESHSYFYTLHGLPGGDPAVGIGCNLAGPTGFEYLDPAPVSVPAMSCASVSIRVDRPAGLTGQSRTSCYEAVAWDTETGVRMRDTGVLRSKTFFCPVVVDNGNSFELGSADALKAGFDIRNITGQKQVYRWRVEGLPEGAVQLNGLKPGQDLRGQVTADPNKTEHVELRLSAPGLSPGEEGEYRLHIEASGERAQDPEPEGGAGFRVAPRNNAREPADVRVEVLGKGALRAGEEASYKVRLHNSGRTYLSSPIQVALELAPGLDVLGADDERFTCRAPEPGSDARLACTADAALPPGRAMDLLVRVLPGFRPEPVMKVCASAVMAGEVDLHDNRHCLTRDYGMAQRRADLGDAPDSSNHRGSPGAGHDASHEPAPPGVSVPADLPNLKHHSHFHSSMYAYRGVQLGNFPTVYNPELSKVQGPIHWQPMAAAWLGPGVSGEHDADSGSDEDGKTNLDPIKDSADRDGQDDGVVPTSLLLPECDLTTIMVKVTVKDPRIKQLLNVWFDFNRDGDWNDTFTCTSRGRRLTVREWAVRDQALALPAGVHTVRTPEFVASGVPTPSRQLWMRVMLSEGPAPAPGDGRGPYAGYRFGETEDYLLPFPASVVSRDAGTPAAASRAARRLPARNPIHRPGAASPTAARPAGRRPPAAPLR